LWSCHGSVQKRVAFGAFPAPHHARPGPFPSLTAAADREAGRGGERGDRRHPLVCVCSVFDKGTRATGRHARSRAHTNTRSLFIMRCQGLGAKSRQLCSHYCYWRGSEGESLERRRHTGRQTETLHRQARRQRDWDLRHRQRERYCTTVGN
jgi:hypothetical protein